MRDDSRVLVSCSRTRKRCEQDFSGKSVRTPTGARKTNGKVFRGKENSWKGFLGHGKLMEKFSGARKTHGKVVQGKANSWKVVQGKEN
jgi:hypothetical protein